MAKDQPSQGVSGQPVLRSALPPPPPCKLLEKMRANPAGDWTIADVETLCSQTGMIFKQPTRGSHTKVVVPGMKEILTIPAHNPVSPYYIRRLVRHADHLRSNGAPGATP